ncbi:DUF5908 family protein [Pedobacter panaciterrae]|jgi:hypothetical protein|uniref:DUF5908 family protein n=1 Tax=Pedobacter panaciterrae TaxID=363849 RepID=A0ABU8NJW2_9SPHI|nr:DUF5908 family protein [Pedobacter panaciterrae]NQX56166.1 hypothetical protein [Pedobacter panaciterrae]
MPIIINEIEIAVSVSDDASSSGAHQGSNTPSKEDIIKECVEQVMEILKQKNER